MLHASVPGQQGPPILNAEVERLVAGPSVDFVLATVAQPCSIGL